MLKYALLVAGLFTVGLGAAHLVFPRIVGFRQAMKAGPVPLALPMVHYSTTERDRIGLILVMNYAVSFVLLSIGALDLLCDRWLTKEVGGWVAGWIAAWWLLRAAAQMHLGTRLFDWTVAAWFVALGILHFIACVA